MYGISRQTLYIHVNIIILLSTKNFHTFYYTYCTYYIRYVNGGTANDKFSEILFARQTCTSMDIIYNGHAGIYLVLCAC